jgi:transcriptional regulator with GAF, ATPase, and Fis domain
MLMFRTQQATAETDSWTCIAPASHTEQYGDCLSGPGVRSDGASAALEVGLKAPVDVQRRFLVASLSDATDRLRLSADLSTATSGHSEIQQLIARLAERFVSVAPHALDDTIVEGLHQFADALCVDWAVLCRNVADDEAVVALQRWVKSPEPSPGDASRLTSVPFIAAAFEAGEPTWFAHLDEVPDLADRERLQQLSIRSAIIVPVIPTGGATAKSAALTFCCTARDREWAPAVIEQLRLLAGVLALALARAASLWALQRAVNELRQFKERTAAEPVVGSPVGRLFPGSRPIVSEAPAVRVAVAQVEQVAPTPSTVLLLGETGVGKEVFARAIHERSPRRHRQMVRVSCAAIPSTLIESELFGRERGAYTGALSRQIGRFELANQSTLFLDEIGDLSAEVQIKLLRVPEERVIERLGSTQSVKIDVRIIAATNRNLEKAVEESRFREDLFYRLNVFQIAIPPLRERIEDIPALVWEFVDEFSKAFGKRIDFISKESMRQLQLHSWPGNVRELRNVIERAMIVATGPQLTVTMPAPAGARQTKASQTLKDFEIEHIRAALSSTNWRIRGAGGAAEHLGVKPTTLETRMARLGVIRPQPSESGSS